MRLTNIVQEVKGILPYKMDFLNQEFSYVFASDLMSDVLAMVTHDFEKTILVTGLINPQVFKTAEMLDIKVIIFARGKELTRDLINTASESGIQLIVTYLSMFEVCGRLYENNMKGF